MARPDRLAASMVKLARRRGRLPALVAALSIGAYLVLKQVVEVLIGWASSAAYASASFSQLGEPYGATSGPSFALVPTPLVQQVLPFALGVFIGLWLIAPVADELTLRFVLTRGALATAVGAVLVILVGIVIALVYGFATVDQAGQLRLDADFFSVRSFLHGVVLALSAGVSLFVYELLPVLFATVLLWLWLREHPRDYAVSGLIDEV